MFLHTVFCILHSVEPPLIEIIPNCLEWIKYEISTECFFKAYCKISGLKYNILNLNLGV